MRFKLFVFIIGIALCSSLPVSVKKDLSSEEIVHYNYTELSDLIQGRLNPKVDPCDDFYEFACGGMLSDVEIPDDMDEIGVIGAIEEKTRYQLLDVLNNSIVEDEIAPFKLAKIFFRKCLDEGNYTLFCHIKPLRNCGV